MGILNFKGSLIKLSLFISIATGQIILSKVGTILKFKA